ncbi:MAG: c-type cytochrome, partial [Planctomycetaceae bacterium]|nr:c-type cytochrome [Planctomycetaceae bacterium]
MFEFSLRNISLTGFVLLLVAASSIATLAEKPTGKSQAALDVDFNRDIRPILSKNCFHCHGPDAETREAGLRLDQRSSAIAKLESDEHAIVPNNAEKSELVQRIITSDESLVMPPPDVGEKLTASQIAKIKAWIEQGAPYALHW